MNHIVGYISMSGHSKKIANAISKELQLPLCDLKKASEFPECDQLILVSGIYSGETHPKLLPLLDTLDPAKIKNVLLIISSAKGGMQGSVKQKIVEKGITISGEYNCYGSFAFMKFGHPNRSEIDQAIAFTKAHI